MTLAIIAKVTDELMITIVCRQRNSFSQQADDFAETAHLPTRALNALDVFLKMLFENDVTHQIPRAAIAFSAEE